MGPAALRAQMRPGEENSQRRAATTIRATVAGRTMAKRGSLTIAAHAEGSTRSRMVRSSTELASSPQDRERVGAGTDADTAVARANLRTWKTPSAGRLARDQALRALELLVGRYPAAEVSAALSCSRCLSPRRPVFRCRCWSGGPM